MIEINGEKGGGQMLRTALTLSAVTGKNFEIENIRGSRKDPGLKNQHLQAVKAAKKVCNAKTEGVEFNSERIVFKPGNLRSKDLKIDIGTAGSANLVLDTLLPITSQFDEEFAVEVSGGTDVRWSPSSLYYKHVKLPLLKQHDFKGSYTVEGTGFYPEGGGKIRLETRPYSLKELDLVQRGPLEELKLFKKSSEDLKDDGEAEEALESLGSELGADISVSESCEYVDPVSTGEVTLLKASYSGSVAGFDVVDERGNRREQNCFRLKKQFNRFKGSHACVDGFMADQLIVFLAVVGGEVAVRELTDHVKTNLSVVEEFGRKVKYEKERDRVMLKR
ncbi:MAG: RNA 3'-terminal phosphate cyclase [Candidatus Nanohalobium sp.]